MLVGAATLQHMDLQIPETLTFISSKGAHIRHEGILPTIPRSNFAEEVVMSLGTTDFDPWWLHSERLVNDPQVATWTYRSSEPAVLTLVDHVFH